MKKYTGLTAAGPVYYRMYQQTFTVQNKPAAVALKGNHHPSFSLRFGIGQKKTVDAAKICGGAENVVKIETQQTFGGKWIARFYYFRHLYSAEARVLLTIIA